MKVEMLFAALAASLALGGYAEANQARDISADEIAAAVKADLDHEIRYPPAVRGYGEAARLAKAWLRNQAASTRYLGQVMLVYPAEVGEALVDLHAKTKEAKYLDAARNIAATYLRLRSRRTRTRDATVQSGSSLFALMGTDPE